ncbi:6-pyruvoyl trahydropterin synthase family protein [Pokkaliibacter sp. CJK22405]|uniref:6-pyruvoyl trahydropterin synthase family protein n=1 Tax=Pokkaliibacter sp. CJK22405 TaxID=3384615 RepID=UPI0039846F78
MALTLFVDNLTVLDCSFLDDTDGVCGASWQVNIELDGDLDEQSMLLDFGNVKKLIKRLIDQSLDHTLLVPEQNPAVQITRTDQASVTIIVPAFGLKTSGPAQAYSLIPVEKLTEETIARHIERVLKAHLPANLNDVRITLEEEQGKGSFYRYSHGLKKHDGNCQRIVHGHRSTLQIWRDGVRDSTTEECWSQRWKDIYLGTREDLTGQDETHFHFAYEANQGAFSVSLPRDRCEIIDYDTTVEELTRYIAETLSQEAPQHEWKVRGFEGIGKGAIVKIPQANH